MNFKEQSETNIGLWQRILLFELVVLREKFSSALTALTWAGECYHLYKYTGSPERASDPGTEVKTNLEKFSSTLTALTWAGECYRLYKYTGSPEGASDPSTGRNPVIVEI